jgi:hypothetical protein
MNNLNIVQEKKFEYNVNLELMLLLSYVHNPVDDLSVQEKINLAIDETGEKEHLMSIQQEYYIDFHLEALELLYQNQILSSKELEDIKNLILNKNYWKLEVIKEMKQQRNVINELKVSERCKEEYLFYRHSGCVAIKSLYDNCTPILQDSISKGALEVIHDKYKVLK